MTEKVWQGEERRRDITLEVLKEMREWFEQHEKDEHMKFSAIQDEIRETRKQADDRHDEMLRRFEHVSQSTLNVVNEQNHSLREIHALFQTAFPEGNAEDHRRAHEQWIKKADEEKEFWLDIKKKAIGAIVTAIVLWAGIALWGAAVKGPQPAPVVSEGAR